MAHPGSAPDAQAVARMEAVQRTRYQETVGDSYKIRRLEGRPKHGQLSLTILIIGGASWFGNLFALVMPHWRGTWVGTFGYTSRRSWGLLWVTGRESTDYYTMQRVACAGYADLNVGGLCLSPICQWYRLKCYQYHMFYLLSHSVAFVFVLNLMFHAMAVVWVWRLSPRLIRWSTCTWPFLCLSHIACIAVWFVMSQEIFEALNSQSYYPTPGMSYCCFLALLTTVGMLVNSILSCQLRQLWPEPDSGSDTEDEDSDSQVGDNRRGQQYGGKGPPGGVPAAYLGGKGYPTAHAGYPQAGYPADAMFGLGVVGTAAAPPPAAYAPPGAVYGAHSPPDAQNW